MPPRFRLHAAEDVGRATALVLVVAPGHVSRTSRLRSANVPVQHYRLFVDANHRLLLRERPFIESQNVFHAPDVLLIQFRHAPHFFPATASGRGSEEGCAPSPALHAPPVCASPPPGRSTAPTNEPGLPAAARRPWR